MSLLTLKPEHVSAICSPGWLESLKSEELAALELELEDLVSKQGGQEEKSRTEIEKQCQESSLFWLQNYTATENPKHKEQGLAYRAPFPRKSYFNPLFQAFNAQSRLFVPKTREMLTSWCVMGDSAHKAQWER